jgi:hypothetical protein
MHYLDKTKGTYLDKCKKVVYLGCRKFFLTNHQVRKKGKHFNGEADHWKKPKLPKGADVFGMVKDLEVIFGKGPGGQSVPKDPITGHTVTRVNSTNVLDEGLRIGGIGRRMNSKVKSVKQGVCRK